MQIEEASEHRPGDYGRWGEQLVVSLTSLLPALASSLSFFLLYSLAVLLLLFLTGSVIVCQ